MESPIITREKIRVDINDEIMSFSFRLGTVICAVIGLWAVACLATGLLSVGPLQLVRGYLTAITGL